MKRLPPIFITGLPRSGTSMTAGILNKLGVFAGETISGGPANPKGFYENIVIREQIVKSILSFYGKCPLGIKSLPPIDFNPNVLINKQTLSDVLYNVILDQGYSGSLPFMYKDPKLTLMWRIFHSNFPNAYWIIVRRNRSDFIRSCLKTHFMFQHSKDPSFWHEIADTYETRLNDLQNSTNRCVEISTDDVINGDYRSIETFCKTVSVPFSYEIVTDFVEPKFWRRPSYD